ncbi:MAG: nitrilase [Proteobacteria bacterium]|nr:nitrilase [Pseudomonadota bacterium]
MIDTCVAVVSLNVPFARIHDNLGRMAGYIKEAGEKGARMICFPELGITGYATGDKIEHAAIPVNGNEVGVLKDLSTRHNVVILAGLAEKDKANHIYATHLVIMPDKTVAIYRKLHIAPPEKKIFKAGKNIEIFEWNGFRFGIQLCYDAHFPELTTEMALKGVDAVFIPHASPRGTPEGKFDSWMRHLSARAYDNGIFIIACNQCGKNGNGLTFPGLVIVIGPSGEVLTSETSGHDSMVVTTLLKQDIDDVRNHRMRYFLPNRRPELYRHLQTGI